MSKKNLAKRLIALVAIVTMFAAMTITASAAEYSSTTVYMGNGTVKVSTSVTGLEKDDEVTYYAKGADDVYVNQYTAEGSTLEKDYVADLEKIDGMTIKMAKVNADFGGYAEIGVDENEGAFLFILGDAQVYSSDVAPAVDDIVETDIPVLNDEEKSISSVTAIYKGRSYDFPVIIMGNKVSIANPINFGEDTGMKYVVLNATYGDNTDVPGVTFNYIGAQKRENYTVDAGTEDPVTGKLFAVAYDIDSAITPTEYGIKITGVDEPFPAHAASVDGKFAIALVDPNLQSFEYTPYVVVDGETINGETRNAVIE